jgi:hypothetical protein
VAESPESSPADYPPAPARRATVAKTPNAPGPRAVGVRPFCHDLSMTQIESLAARQLAAYNAADLDAFCDCYHPEVRVLDDLEERLVGIAAFRERYRDLFTRWTFGAEVTQRLVLGPHAIDLERWWRIDPDQGQRSEGEVLVRYSLRDDRIGTVQFLRP